MIHRGGHSVTTATLRNIPSEPPSFRLALGLARRRRLSPSKRHSTVLSPHFGLGHAPEFCPPDCKDPKIGPGMQCSGDGVCASDDQGVLCTCKHLRRRLLADPEEDKCTSST